MAVGVMSCRLIHLDGEQYIYFEIYALRQNDGRRNVILPNVLVKNVDKHSMLVQIANPIKFLGKLISFIHPFL